MQPQIPNSALHPLADRNFNAPEFQQQEKGLVIYADSLKLDPETVIGDFGAAGFYLFLRRSGDRVMAVPARKRRPEEPRKSWRRHMHWLLLLATVCTTVWGGYLFADWYLEAGGFGNRWLWMFTFSFGLLIVLGGHELGHKLTADRKGIEATPPYFIPVPPEIFIPGLGWMPLFIFGTMGAVIKMKSPIPDRNAMIKMGASGPIVGFLLMVPVLIAGLSLSTLTPHTPLGPGQYIAFSDANLLIRAVVWIMFSVPEGYSINPHPLFFAGWLGLIVTMLNLIPMGQLDGAHVVRAFLGPVWAWRVSFLIVGLLLMAGYYFWPGWYLWALIGYLLARRPHPGALDEITPISPTGRLLAAALVVIFLLSALPVPIHSHNQSFIQAVVDAVAF